MQNEARHVNQLLWKHHISNRTEADYAKASVDLRNWIRRSCSEPQAAWNFEKHYSFLATDLLPTQDAWDSVRVGYTAGRTPEDYTRYLAEEFNEFSEKPVDIEEMADVIVFANRLFFHPNSSDAQRAVGVRMMVDFVDLVEKTLEYVSLGKAKMPVGYERCTSVKEVVLRKVERNSMHYDESISDQPDGGLGGAGMFMRRIRDQFGGQIPFWEDVYNNLPDGSIKVSPDGVVVRNIMSPEQEAAFAGLYVSEDEIAAGWKKHTYGDQHNRLAMLAREYKAAGVPAHLTLKFLGADVFNEPL